MDHLEIPELDNAETNPPENHQDNGATPPVNTKPYPPHSPLEYSSVAPTAPPSCPRVKASNATLQSQEGYFPDVWLLGANYMLYGVYQNWVHQNPGDHLNEGIAEDSKWQVCGKKFVCMTIQRYYAPSGKVSERSLRIQSVELDGVRARKWNADGVIIYQSVLPQHAQGLNNSVQIRKRILFWIDLCNCGEFYQFLKNMYNYTMGYPRNILVHKLRRNVINRFWTFSWRGNYVKPYNSSLKEKRGGVFQPDELAADHTGKVNDTVASVLEGKHTSKKISLMLC